MSNHPLARLLPVLSVLAALLAPGRAVAADSWTRVAAGGLGDPSRHAVHALAVHDGGVWVASRGGDGRPRIFRAALVADGTWVERTPPWTALDGVVTDLEPFAGDLWVATSFGQVWRHRRASGWSNATPRWTGSLAVHDLVAWRLAAGALTLCAARGSVQVHCGVETGAPTALPRVPLADPATVGEAHLRGFRDRLFLAVGGETVSSRSCEVLAFGAAWSSVTSDCFGEAERTWTSPMAVFREHLYIATGTHTAVNGVFELTPGGAFREVTPPFYAFSPVNRFASTAVAVGQLFVGAHVGLPPPGYADVVRTRDAATWHHSSEPGFAPGSTNVSPSRLATSGLLLYAGVTNIGESEGLEIWRRNHLLVEMLDENAAAYRDLVHDARRQIVCLRLPVPRGCPGWPTVLERFATVKLGFDTARHPQDDAKLILVAQGGLAKAEKELRVALELAGEAEKLARLDPAKARVLRLQAAQRLEAAVKATSVVWDAAVAAQRGKG